MIAVIRPYLLNNTWKITAMTSKLNNCILILVVIQRKYFNAVQKNNYLLWIIVDE